MSNETSFGQKPARSQSQSQSQSQNQSQSQSQFKNQIRKLIPLTFAFTALGSAFIALGSFATPQTATEATVIPCVVAFSGDVCAETKWIAGPTSDGESQMQLQFTDAKTGQPKAPAAPLKVDLWMPDMGHGSSPVKIISGTNPGLYQVNEMFFIMPGAWDVRIHVGEETRSFSVPVP